MTVEIVNEKVGVVLHTEVCSPWTPVLAESAVDRCREENTCRVVVGMGRGQASARIKRVYGLDARDVPWCGSVWWY